MKLTLHTLISVARLVPAAAGPDEHSPIRSPLTPFELVGVGPRHRRRPLVGDNHWSRPAGSRRGHPDPRAGTHRKRELRQLPAPKSPSRTTPCHLAAASFPPARPPLVETGSSPAWSALGWQPSWVSPPRSAPWCRVGHRRRSEAAGSPVTSLDSPDTGIGAPPGGGAAGEGGRAGDRPGRTALHRAPARRHRGGDGRGPRPATGRGDRGGGERRGRIAAARPAGSASNRSEAASAFRPSPSWSVDSEDRSRRRRSGTGRWGTPSGAAPARVGVASEASPHDGRGQPGPPGHSAAGVMGRLGAGLAHRPGRHSRPGVSIVTPTICGELGGETPCCS